MKNAATMFVALLLSGQLLSLATIAAKDAGAHPDQLLITSVRTGDTEIFTINPSTGDALNLSRSPASEDRYPMWSPDGRRVVFNSNRDGSGAYNIYVMNADGTGVRQLTFEKGKAICYFPTWAGERIYFGLDRMDGSAPVICFVTPENPVTKVVAEGRDPCISPDGKTIAFTKKVNQGYCVFTMSADGGNVRQLTTHEDEIGAVTPTWSPDGRKISYSDQVGDALEIFVCDADGSNVKQLTSLGKISSSTAWSPDGSQITFRVTDDPYWRDRTRMAKTYENKQGDKRPVWVMKADGTEPHIVEVLRYQCAMDGSRAVWKPRDWKVRGSAR